MLLSRITSFFVVAFYPLTLLSAQSPNPITKGYLELLPIDKFVDALSLEELSEVIVTDTKIAQSVHSVTQNIQVIDQTEFERLGENRRNLAELLQYTSGQFVNILSRNDANWGSYAGLGAKYNTYMLDGLPMDSFVDAMSLDPWAFERVEVQKGPASILYSNYMSMDFAGNEAPLAGTTNFILKDKIERQMSRLQLGIGSYSTQNARAYHQDKKGDLSYFVGANLEKSNYTQYGEALSWLQTVNNPDYQKTKLYGKMAYDVSPNQKVSLFFHHTDHTGDTGRVYRDFDHRYETLNLKYNAKLSDALELQIQGGLRDYTRQFVNDNYPIDLSYTNTDHYRQTIVPVDATLNYKHGDGNVLTLGTDAQWNYFKSYRTDALLAISSQNDVKARSNGLFLQEKVQLGEWIVRGGVRYNHIRHDYTLLGGVTPEDKEASWFHTLWNIGARWNMSPTFSWYANSGTSFMTPSAKQVGGTITNPLTDSGQLSNASLQSEFGMGNDIGFQWHANEHLQYGMRFFYNKIKDAIVDSVIKTSPSQSQSFNAGQTVARGVELDMKHRVEETWEYFANFTYTNTHVEESQHSDSDGAAIPFVPNYVANIGITTLLPWEVTSSGYIQYVGKYYDSTAKSSRSEFGNYPLINAKLQKNILRNSEYSINALVELNNIADRRYVMPWGFIDPGFNAYASVLVTF